MPPPCARPARASIGRWPYPGRTRDWPVELLFLRGALLRRSAAASAAGTRRHLATRAARLGKADGNRLFGAGHLLPGTSATQRAFLAFMHRALDLGLRLLAIPRHDHSSSVVPARTCAHDACLRCRLTPTLRTHLRPIGLRELAVGTRALQSF